MPREDPAKLLNGRRRGEGFDVWGRLRVDTPFCDYQRFGRVQDAK